MEDIYTGYSESQEVQTESRWTDVLAKLVDACQIS